MTRADKRLSALYPEISRTEAQELIRSGLVTRDGRVIAKPSEECPDDAELVVSGSVRKYVSRGGLKLEGAIRAFSLEDRIRDARALDIGASTGGFTDCLLAFGCAHVVALDAGHDQLASKLRSDTRVTVIEDCNARSVTCERIGGPVSLITMDVSFISQTCIHPALPALCGPEARLVTLIKPQFECGKSAVGRGGIVRDPAAHRFAVERVVGSAESCGFRLCGLTDSPVLGGDGNREYLACFRFAPEDQSRTDPDTVCKEVTL